MKAEKILWKCGSCMKEFENYKKLLRHLDQWHSMTSCRFCDKTMKKGSIFVHVKRFHTQKKEDIMDLTEVSALNKKLDQSMDQSIQEIINSIDSPKEIFQNVNMEQYICKFLTKLHPCSPKPLLKKSSTKSNSIG